MIALATIASGSTLIIRETADSTLRQAEARVSRVATLDGGVVLSHYGFSHGDRTFNVRAKITAADVATLESIHQNNTLLWIAAPDGFYTGAIREIQTDGGVLKLTIYIKERLT